MGSNVDVKSKATSCLHVVLTLVKAVVCDLVAHGQQMLCCPDPVTVGFDDHGFNPVGRAEGLK